MKAADLSTQKMLVIGGISLDTNVHVYKLPVGDDNADVSYVTHRIKDHLGGSSMNVGLALRSLGLDFQLISVTGKDFAGEYLMKRLKELDINTDYILHHWKNTGRSVNLVDPSGRKFILHDAKDSMEYIMPEENYVHLLKPGSIAHFSVVNWTRPIIKEARQRGVATCTDLHAGFDINGYHKDYIENARILFFSAQGLADWIDAGLTMLAMGPETVICMMAEKGCALFEKGGYTHYPPQKYTDNIVDSVGAGDAMVGAYLACRLRNIDRDESIKRAQISGLYACTSQGTENCYIDHETLEEIVNRR